MRQSSAIPEILVVGGGCVGLYTALRLKRRLRRGEAHITVVDPRSYMTYQPFLPEAAAGSLEPRHVVVSLRRELSGVRVVTGRLTALRHAEKTACITPETGVAYELSYDHVVMAMGSVARTLPIPGLYENGIGFKQVEEAIALRNHVIERLDPGVAAADEDERERSPALGAPQRLGDVEALR